MNTKNFIDIPEINERIEITPGGAIYIIMTGGYRSNMPILMRRDGIWTRYHDKKPLEQLRDESVWWQCISMYV
jgi:hypothetical protein